MLRRGRTSARPFSNLKLVIFFAYILYRCSSVSFRSNDNSSLKSASRIFQHMAYTADWKSLDSRVNPVWFDEAKFGIFMHWGLYSVPSYESEWFWYEWEGRNNSDVIKFMKDNYRPGFNYADFAPMFTAEFFDAKKFASIIKNSGAKYFVLTSKHHEGFTMWPSKYAWNWNSMDVGPKADIVGEMRDAILEVNDVRFGLYYSQMEWFNPLYMKDQENNYSTNDYVTRTTMPQLFEIVNQYHPEILWSDGDWNTPDTYWNSTSFLAWLFNSSPVKDTVLVNDRWGKGTRGQHGSYFNYDDRFDPGILKAHKWENCLTIDKPSWGFRRTMTLEDVLSINEIITKLARTISCGGNLLLNVGPTSYGTIDPIFVERLNQMGQWLKVNGEAVYGTKPWVHQHDSKATNVWFTSSLRKTIGEDQNRIFNPQRTENTIVYAFILDWPKGGQLELGTSHPTELTKIFMLGIDGILKFKSLEEGMRIDFNQIKFDQLPSYCAWVLKLEYLAETYNNPIIQ